MNRLRASIILVAFAFGLLAAPLFASYGTCPMPCCKHGKSASVNVPACPLPQSCPSMARDTDNENRHNAAPAPGQPAVHAAPAVVATVSCPRPIGVREDGQRPALHATSERPVYLVDSVFLI